MEPKRLSSKAQPLSKDQPDANPTLPEVILEAILYLLPLEEAARTSILSREWRYKWTKIPKVVFLEDTVKALPREIEWESEFLDEMRSAKMRSKLFHAVLQVLCTRQGPIHEFTFWMTEHHTFFDIDQIILHLARNHHTLKKLTLDFRYSKSTSRGLPFYLNYSNVTSKGLPLLVFSFYHLTDLHLRDCDINDEPIFCRWDSLTSLQLNRVTMSMENLLHLLSNCPSLRSLYLLLFLSNKERLNATSINIVELFKCLPMIEELTTWDNTIQWFVLDSVPPELPVSLFHLKYFCYEDMGFVNSNRFTFLAVLIKCSPNLEKIKLKNYACDELEFKLEEYSGVWLENLKELEIESSRNLKPELEFVKLILARSPNLKKVIFLTCVANKNEEILEILLRTPHASRVEIIVENRPTIDGGVLVFRSLNCFKNKC